MSIIVIDGESRSMYFQIIEEEEVTLRLQNKVHSSAIVNTVCLIDKILFELKLEFRNHLLSYINDNPGNTNNINTSFIVFISTRYQ